MNDLKKIIDEELESMTFNELRKRRSIKMKRNFGIKRVTAVCASVIAAAMVLAVSTSAMGLWSMTDFIKAFFPSSRVDTVQSYSFKPSAEIEKNSEVYDISFENAICDGNFLLGQFVVTRSDGGELKDEDFTNVFFPDSLFFSDIDDETDSIGKGCATNKLSDDKRSLIINRMYYLPRAARTGDELCIKISLADRLVKYPDKTAGKKPWCENYTLVRFTVSEIVMPVPLNFIDKQGKIAFKADLTPISLKAYSDNKPFDEFAFDVYPKWLDENMEYVEQTSNSVGKYDNSIIIDGNTAVAILVSDPELEKAKYIEWFDCIAEIPENE